MILYVDTSALVKLYVDEERSAVVHSTARRARLIACHKIGYVEARAALARKHRDKELGKGDLSRCKRKLDQDWERCISTG